MTSERRRRANGANAAKSTGPRTTNGKAASSRNAVKHGLTSAASEIDEDLLAKALGIGRGAGARADTQELARALTQLRRIRQAKDRCLAALEAGVMFASGTAMLEPRDRQLAAARIYGVLDGYERKARSRLSRLLKDA